MSEEKDCATCNVDSCWAKKQKNGESEQQLRERQSIASRMCRIKHKVIVMSGKGGVGKTTIAVNLASALMKKGRGVGLMDVDIHGPNVPKMLGIEKAMVRTSNNNTLLPITCRNGLKVMSIGFLLRKDDDAVIWRGPLKMNLIKQFLKDVEWGELDYLIIDSPPGTGDEPLSVVQLIENMTGAVIITTPQQMSILDVKKSITFCKQLNLDIVGIVENMSGFVCPHCGERVEIFSSGGGEELAKKLLLPFLGKIPVDPAITRYSDEGRFLQIDEIKGESPVMEEFEKLVVKFEDSVNAIESLKE